MMRGDANSWLGAWPGAKLHKTHQQGSFLHSSINQLFDVSGHAASCHTKCAIGCMLATWALCSDDERSTYHMEPSCNAQTSTTWVRLLSVEKREGWECHPVTLPSGKMRTDEAIMWTYPGTSVLWGVEA